MFMFDGASNVFQRVKRRISLDDYLYKLGLKSQAEDGSEIVSDVPMEPPLGYQRQPTMVEHIRNMVRSEQLRQEAEAAGAETFDEADDFDVGDGETGPRSPYEVEEFFDPPAPVEPVAAAPASVEAPALTPAPAVPQAPAEPV